MFSKKQADSRVSHCHLTPMQNGVIHPLNIVVYINVKAAATIMGLTWSGSSSHPHCCTNVPPFQVDAFKGGMAGFHDLNSIDLWWPMASLRLITFFLLFLLDSLLVLGVRFFSPPTRKANVPLLLKTLTNWSEKIIIDPVEGSF